MNLMVSRSKVVSDKTIETIIIGCSADETHSHWVQELSESEIVGFSNQRGKDFLEVAVPGTFPTPDLFDSIESLALRFSVEKIVAITHSGCGAIIGIDEQLKNPTKSPELFADPSKIVCDAFESLNIAVENGLGNRFNDLAYAQAKVVANYIATEMDKKRTKRLAGVDSADNPEEEQIFCDILGKLQIGVFVSLPPDVKPIKVVDFATSQSILNDSALRN